MSAAVHPAGTTATPPAVPDKNAAQPSNLPPLNKKTMEVAPSPGPAKEVENEKLGNKSDDEEGKSLNILVRMIDSTFASVIFTLITLFALFGDDIRVSSCDKSYDDFFADASFVCFILFCLEILINFTFKGEYRWSFYFWLDLLSTASVIPDIDWLWDGIISNNNSSQNFSASIAKKASQTAQASSKAGRIVRIVRLVRIVRIVKLYKLKNKGKEGELEMKEVEEIEPSKIGKLLTELITRRLILLVLVIIVFVPVLDGSLLTDENSGTAFALNNLHRLPQDYNATGTVNADYFKARVEDYVRVTANIANIRVCPSGCETSWPEETIQTWLKTMKFQTLDSTGLAFDVTANFTETVNPLNDWSYEKYFIPSDELGEKLRSSDMYTSEVTGCYDHEGKCIDCDGDSPCRTYVILNISDDNKASSILNVVKTLVMIIIMGGGSIIFTRDAQIVVIGPIERMINLVQKLAENPLASLNKNAREEEAAIADAESYMLEKTLKKIGALLQVGFGSAGTEIIGKNLSGDGELNVMIAGKKITSIFCFGIIEGFTNTCSDLEEDIITYINSIAEIIHNCAHQYYGAANKNIGSAFLLAWKMCNGGLPLLRDPRDTEKPLKTPEILKEARKGISMRLTGGGTVERAITPTEFFDSALTAVLKMQIDVHNINQVKPGKDFDGFLRMPKVARKFGEHGFEVHMGFGLHVGWAIEGAIGSRFKIDASYLSPNVNMAARLEAATGQFHTHLLISEWFMEELSPAAQKQCRMIDRVTVKGSSIPMGMYTFDVSNYIPNSFTIKISDKGIQMPVDFEKDPTYREIQKDIPPRFMEVFKSGVDKYLEGDWTAARNFLEEGLSLYDDGPSHVLLKVMSESDFKAPSTWKGFRELTEK